MATPAPFRLFILFIPFLWYTCLLLGSFAIPQCLASLTVCRGHIPCLPPGLFHFMSQPRAFTGRAACSLWCGYRIVYSAIPDTELHPLPRPERYAMQHCLTSSGAGYVTYTITAHHVRCTFTASCICVSCSGHASCYASQVPHSQDHFVCIACWSPHLPQFILLDFVAAMWVHLLAQPPSARLNPRFPLFTLHIPLFTFHSSHSTLHFSLFTFHLSLITYHFPRLHATSELSICTAATVNAEGSSTCFCINYFINSTLQTRTFYIFVLDRHSYITIYKRITIV